jgi:hypothetical protein
VEHNLERDDWIVGGLALLLLIAVLVFPWYSVTVSAGQFSVSETRPAIQAPYAWPAILAALALVWLLVDLIWQRSIPDKKLPTIRDGRTTRFVCAVLAAVFLVLKLLLHDGNLGWGFFLIVIVAVALIYTSLQVSRGASAFPIR